MKAAQKLFKYNANSAHDLLQKKPQERYDAFTGATMDVISATSEFGRQRKARL